MKNVLATMKLINLINLYFDTGLNVTTDNFLKKPFSCQEAEKQNKHDWHCASKKKRDS